MSPMKLSTGVKPMPMGPAGAPANTPQPAAKPEMAGISQAGAPMKGPPPVQGGPKPEDQQPNPGLSQMGKMQAAKPTLGQMDQMRMQQMQATGMDPGLEAAKLNAMKANQLQGAGPSLQRAEMPQAPDQAQQMEQMKAELQRMQSDPNTNPADLQKAVAMFQQREQAFGQQKVGAAPGQLQNMAPTLGQLDAMRAQEAAAQGNQFALQKMQQSSQFPQRQQFEQPGQQLTQQERDPGMMMMREAAQRARARRARKGRAAF